MKRLFVFGLGFSARALALNLARDGWEIAATSTTPDGVREINDNGYQGYLFDGRQPGQHVAEALSQASHVLVSVPAGESGDPVFNQHQNDLSFASNVGWIGYLSTIGVYGDRKGNWVDETDAAKPTSPRSKFRLKAERAWLDFAIVANIKTQIFRLAGIYGPGRGPLDKVRSGRARRIIKPGQVFNRIHVEDIASTLQAAMGPGGSHDIYNVCDDEPAPPQDVIAFAAQLLDVAPPPSIPIDAAGLSEMALSFYSENKRVRNQRIKDDLGVQLAFPTYREGLTALASGI